VSWIKRDLGVLVSLCITAGAFQFASGGIFFEMGNLGGIFSLAAETGLVALGATLLIIAGEFDLSVGSTFAAAGMLFALLTTQTGLPPLAAALVVLAVSCAIGVINGWITIKAQIPSFITTLGMLMILRGAVLGVSHGWPVSWEGDPSPFMQVISGSLSATYETVRLSSFWWLFLGAAAHLVLFRTPFGNWLLATGGNAGAARAAGIPVNRVKISAFVVSSALAAFAGITQFSRMGSFSPTYGEGMELDAIAAAVIGGTALTGGKGGILGTILGTLLVSMVASGLVLAGAPVYWYRVFVGVILIMAVVINRRLSA
jgi:ribose/xylose/arabinose/galactoside ABC-type transport system permease subunit